MSLKQLLAATAAIALMSGSAYAQEGAKPAASPAPTQTAAAPSASGDIVETAQAAGQFSTFLKAAEATNLTGLLKTNKNLTVFAPTDAAFAALPAGELDKLMLPENKAQLQKLLIGHVVNASVKTADFKGATREAPTVAGTTVKLSGGDELMVNDAHIVQADLTASNGVIQVIDKVLVSGGAASAAAAGAPASATAPAEPAPRPSADNADSKLALAGTTLQCQDAAAQPEAADPTMKEEAAPAPDAAAPSPDVGAAPAPEAPAPAPAAAPGADASAVVTNEDGKAVTTSMQPVPDTKENRAAYKPLSNAGKRSSAKGN